MTRGGRRREGSESEGKVLLQGFIMCPVPHHLSDGEVVRVAEGSPLKAAGTPEAVAEPVVWLLEGAEHMTGQNFVIDGGLHLIGFPG